MDEIQERVLQCVAGVFPEVDPRQLPQLSQDTHPGWDSVAHVTLIAALSETFEVDFDFEAFTEATSSARLVALVEAQLASAR